MPLDLAIVVAALICIANVVMAVRHLFALRPAREQARTSGNARPSSGR